MSSSDIKDKTLANLYQLLGLGLRFNLIDTIVSEERYSGYSLMKETISGDTLLLVDHSTQSSTSGESSKWKNLDINAGSVIKSTWSYSSSGGLAAPIIQAPSGRT